MYDIASWQLAAIAFLSYVLVVALVRPGMSVPARGRAIVGAVIGLGMAGVAVWLPPHPVLHGWILPPTLLLLGYWSSGALFVAPMLWAERLLEGADRVLGIAPLAARTPRLAAEFLELAYGLVYPLIPAALALHLLYSPSPDSDRFWTVILVTDFVCFGVLPWVQTRPPRALEAADPWRASARALNLRLLGAASIRVNTFPSGHAAEALACALLVSGAPAPIAAGLFAMAGAISAGAVLGRYHYALDVLAGWAVALAVWALA